ncbi:unnamed protein product [Allacma fusca]|uniref:HTH psq-type domain-containing protein n=1 Tax=Allacma fusca TaxID=39272 RepID=A0A8J2JLX4_9HEXA|nr:unnamed protein product [Allacma fusca]
MLSPVVHKYQRKTVEVDGEVLKAALKFVKAGNTYRAAEDTYGVPKSTIHKYRNTDIDQIPSHLTQGRFKNVFSEAQEKVICDYAIDISRRFYALTRKGLGHIAYSLAVENNLPHRFKNGAASDKWVSLFMERNRHRLSMRIGTPTSLSRILGFNKPAVYKFFDKLEALVGLHGFSAETIYNMDETSTTIVPVRFSKKHVL